MGGQRRSSTLLRGTSHWSINSRYIPALKTEICGKWKSGKSKEHKNRHQLCIRKRPFTWWNLLDIDRSTRYWWTLITMTTTGQSRERQEDSGIDDLLRPLTYNCFPLLVFYAPFSTVFLLHVNIVVSSLF